MCIKPLRETPLRRVRLGDGVRDLAVRGIERVEAIFLPVSEPLDTAAVQTDLVRINGPVFVVVAAAVPVVASPVPGFDGATAARMCSRDIFQRFGCDGGKPGCFGRCRRLALDAVHTCCLGGRVRCYHIRALASDQKNRENRENQEHSHQSNLYRKMTI